MPGPTSEFFNSLDVANRACQLLGVPRIASFTEDSKAASELAFAIDKVRRAELQRNLWRFSIREVALRAIDATVLELVPAAYNASDTYLVGSIVSYNNQIWQASAQVPAATQPDISPAYWDVYFGSMAVSQWADPTVSSSTTNNQGYYAGELVYVLTGATPAIFLSLTNGNQDNPSTTPAWSATVTYNKGATVVQSAVNYQSLIDLNLNNAPPSAQWEAIPGTEPQTMVGPNWLKLDATLKSIQIVYPLNAGPGTQSTTKNIYQLPNGFLKEAPQDPKAGSISFLGAPSGLTATDWVLSGNYLLSAADKVVLLLRFAGDITSVPSMTSMFCEGWACRLAAATCEAITQSVGKLQMIGQEYKAFMGEARMSNAIENGSDEPPIDDWIACRI